MATEQYVNFLANTTLNGAINNSVTALAITPNSFSPSAPQFRIRIDDELILVTAVAGGSNETYTITRGIESSVAASHSSGARVTYVLTAGGLNNILNPFPAAAIISVSSANAFVVGPNANTNPVLRIITNIASSATGLSITGNAAGSGVTLTALSSGSNEKIILATLGTGVVQILNGGGLQISGPSTTGIVNLTNENADLLIGGTIDGTTNKFRLLAYQNDIYFNNTAGGKSYFRSNDPASPHVQMILTDGGLMSLGRGSPDPPTYGLHLAPTSGLTAAQTAFFQDATASTGITTVKIKSGANQGAGDHIFQILDKANAVEIFMRGEDGLVGANTVSDVSFHYFALVSGNSSKFGLTLSNDADVQWSSDATWYGTTDLKLSRADAGRLEVNSGTEGTFRDIIVRQLFAGGDNAGLASTTSLTNATDTTLTNAYVVKGGQTAATANTGWIKIYVGTTVAWIPYWANATP